MVATIVFTQNNIVPNSLNRGNNQLAYQFPNSVSFPNHEIAVQNITMYYSWVNINSTTLNNNTFYYVWYVGSVLTQFAVVIPDGLYEISTINSYLQFRMIANGHYAINTTASTNVYFAEMKINPADYSVQINTYNVPFQFNVAGGTTGITIPGNPNTFALPSSWVSPIPPQPLAPFTPATSNSFIPTIALANPNIVAGAVGATHLYTNFYKTIGYDPTWTSYNTGTSTAPVYSYSAKTYLGGAGAGVNTSAVSVIAPVVQPNPTLFFAISNIDNKYSNPSTIVYQLNADVAFGELISITPPQFAFNKLLPGTYNGLRLSILGTNFQPIEIIDPAMTITLVIKDRKDVSLGDALGQAQGGK